MSWSNQTGGNNGGKNNGNGGSGGGNGGGPWGQRPRGPQRPPDDNEPPDIEEMIRQTQDKFKNIFGGSGGKGKKGNNGGSQIQMPGFLGIPGIIVILALAYAYISAYQVNPDEVGVETRFGVPKEDISPAGLHFAFWPIEKAEKVKIVERETRIGAVNNNSASRQALMLSGDQNIVEVQFTLLYSVADAKDFLFNVKDPEQIVREVGESAMREVVGRSPAQDVFRDNRAGIAEEVRQIIQTTLDSYGAGISIRALNIEDVAPPPKVADAFDEVQRAEQDEDKFQEEANLYRNEALGQARGEAAQIEEDAAAYKNRVVEEAIGEAQRFLSVYEQYAKAPEVTRKRLFLETMEGVLKDSNKVIMENGGQGGTGVVPYLPLPEINKRRGDNQ